jgi:hypothetical protein
MIKTKVCMNSLVHSLNNMSFNVNTVRLLHSTSGSGSCVGSHRHHFYFLQFLQREVYTNQRPSKTKLMDLVP